MGMIAELAEQQPALLPDPLRRQDRSTRPSACLRASMVTRYRLRQPVIGFIESAKQIVTIPAGAIVTPRTDANPSPGLCTVVWDGKVLEVYRRDIERNGEVVSHSNRVGVISPNLPHCYPSGIRASCEPGGSRLCSLLPEG